MKKPILITLAVLLLFSGCKFNSEPVVDEELKNEVFALSNQLEFDKVRELMKAKVDAGLTDVALLQDYGTMEYKIFQDFSSSEKALKRAIKIQPENAGLYKILGEVYYCQGHHESAVAELTTAIELYGEAAGEWDGELSKLYSLLGKAYRGLKENAKAIQSLESAVRYNPFRTEASKVLHQLYVHEENYQRAYEIWKVENRIIDGSDYFLKRTAEDNALYLNALKDGPRHTQMAELYSTLRLYEEALEEYSKAEEEAHDPAIKKEMERIQAFLDFRDKLTAFFEGYYRERCQGGIEFNDFHELLPIYRIISPYVGGEPQTGSAKSKLNALNDKIEEEFGVGIDFVEAGGVMFGLHMGYVVDDFLTQLTQWGGTGNYRLVVLKNMESNGLINWLTEGRSTVGGWNLGNDEMYAVLESNGAYVNLVARLNDSAEEADTEYEENLSRGTVEIFYSPALNNKFQTKQVSTEMSRAAAAGISAELVDSYVVNRFLDSILSTNVVHEGQHALDQRFSGTWYGEYEYRAKLSELTYGDLQFRVLSNIHDQSLDSAPDDKHSAANARVFQDIVQYILDNQGKFPEINTARNVMMQLHLLSEEQIRQIAIAVFEAHYPDEAYQ